MADNSLFNSKMDFFVRSIPNQHYIFEVTKTCGYSEFMIVPKHCSVIDLYQHVSLQFACNIVTLYVTINDNNNIDIPLNENVYVKDFLAEKHLVPIYGVPFPVVYRLFLDDGHQHSN